ncbi:MAG: chorismate synthase [Planctomycetota bacterium]|jgi:chorismate synthase|nr:chorismate synthase [Planctomycetota bacterium]
MNANSAGTLFSYATWGESHGPAIGCVIDGCPSRLPLSEDDIQPLLDRRRPGRNDKVSPRNESDKVKILSGVFEGLTTGHPISLIIENADQRSTDYQRLRDVFRPGHADATHQAKYSHRDPRGGGRTSARETAARVAAGAVALQLLRHSPETRDVVIRGGLVALGDVRIDGRNWDDAQIDANPFFCPDPHAAGRMEEALDRARAAGDSLGGIVEIRVRNAPAGLGEPVYDKLDARFGAMFLGLNAAKGVEIGDGFAAAASCGSANNDAMRAPASGKLGDSFLSNHAGGILGGVSTGAEIVARCALKPTPSIAARQQTVDTNGNEVDLEIGGRHDPAVCIRAVPVLEAMTAAILADFLLLARARGQAFPRSTE